jgi:rhodanese-related sulfurtransferase
MKKINKDNIIHFITGIIMVIIIIFLIKQGNLNLGGSNGNLKENFDQVLEQAPKEKNVNEVENKENGQGNNIQNSQNLVHQLISPQEYKEKLESGQYIHLDIRTHGEYQEERIADGLNIDFYAKDFKDQLNKLDKNKKYIYYCRSGSRSARAVPIFEELGFTEVLELDGGINN